MELSLIDVQQSIYGDNGPPMFPHSASKARNPRLVKRRKLKPAAEPFKLPLVKAVNELRGAESLVACQLPDGFPPELAFRALAAYALLRTLSRELRLSPFTPNVFLRALNLPYPSRLLGQVHVNLLRILLPRLNLGYGYRAHGGSMGVFKKRRLDGIRWPLLGGDNLTYLDNYTWPLFYDDYCHLTADVLWVSKNDTNLYVDINQIGDLAETNDNEKVEEIIEIGSPVRPYTSKARQKDVEQSETLVVAEPIQDSDDEYQGEEEDDCGGENDDEFEMKFQSRKRKSSRSKQAPPRKTLRSTRSSPHRLSPTETANASSSSCSRYDSQDLMPISNLLSAKGNKTGPPAKSFDEAESSLSASMSTPKPGRQSTIVVSSTGSVGDSLVTELELVTGSPLSQSAIVESAQRDVQSQSHETGARLTTSSIDAGTLEHRADNGVGSADYMAGQLRMLQNHHSDGHKPSHVVASQAIPLAPSLAGRAAGSPTRFSFPLRAGQSSRPEGKTYTPQSMATTNKRPPSRFALPLNRARNHAAPPSQPSFVPHGNPSNQVRPEDGVPYSNFSVRWEHSVTSQVPMFQYQSADPSRVMMLEGARPLHRVAGNPPLQQSRHKSIGDQRLTPQPAAIQSKKNQMEVHANIADELEQAFMGSERSSAIDDVENSDELHFDSIEVDDSVRTQVPISEPRDANDLTAWPQFKAIKRMRNGEPYHGLQVEEKIDMLEFLIDELLAIDFIAAEFTKRDAVNGGHAFPYGCLPTQSELDSLENEDECGICGREGDLLCCDECTSSYHTLCLGMAQSTRIPEGKWVCPECRLADPCKFGSLRGGKKSSVDWFTAQDLVAAEKFKGQPHAAMYDYIVGSTHPFPDRSNFRLNALPGSGLSSSVILRGDDKIEFLVVGSFVFLRSRSVDDVQSLGNPLSTKLLPLGQDNLARWLMKLGPEIGSMWPFAQIPQNPREIWNGSSLVSCHVPSTLYFATLDSHGPSFYWSQYRKAPLPKSMKAGAGAQSATLSELENEFVAVDTNRLSGVLSRDMQFDGAISRELKHSTRLFDPYHVISSFMIRLEGSLRRAGLLDELWGTRNSSFRTDMWAQNVKRCRSIPRLAILLVKLVDATHPRCFIEEWHKTPGNTKPVESSTSNTVSSLSARRFNLPKDWSAEAELLRRKWVRCPLWAMRSLMARSRPSGSCCIAAPGQSGGRKRKHGAPPVKVKQSNVVVTEPSESSEAAIRNDQQSQLEDNRSLHETDGKSKDSFEAATDTQLLSESKPPSPFDELENNLDGALPDEGSNERSSRRRPARVATRSAWGSTASTGAFETEEVTSSEMGLLVESEQNKKLAELENFVKAPIPREGHWPLAGRKLFEPAGYLPPFEMRRLARKAGAAAAPFVTYAVTHEVGQTSLSHRWRKRTLECKSYEEILLRIKTLESFVETSTIAAGDTFMRRSASSKKQQNMNTIGCSHRDLQTGVVEYFALDKDRRRGCWVSLANMELAPLIMDLCDRSVTHLKKMEARKKILTEQRNQAIFASSIQSTGADLPLPCHKFAESSSRQDGRCKDKTSYEDNGHPQKARKRDGAERIGSTYALEENIQKWDQEVEASVLQHQLETRQLMIDRTKQGLSLLPPESQMQELRLQRIRCLKTPLEALRSCGVTNALEAAIVARLTRAEINALTMMQGAELAKVSSVDPVPSWPANLRSPPQQAPSLSSNYGTGNEATNRATAASNGFATNGRAMSMMEPLPPAVPSTSNSLSYPPNMNFNPISGANSASVGFPSPMLPYLQHSSLAFHHNGSTPYNIPMNVSVDAWPQNNVIVSNQAVAQSPYGQGGSNTHFTNPSHPIVPQGKFDGYSQAHINGFTNNHPYAQPTHQANPTDPYLSQQHNINSFLQPNFQLNSMGNMPMPTQPNEQSFRANFHAVARPRQQQQQRQTFASQTSAPQGQGEFPIGFDLEPRPIEEMSRNNAQELESLLRRFNRYPR